MSGRSRRVCRAFAPTQYHLDVAADDDRTARAARRGLSRRQRRVGGVGRAVSTRSSSIRSMVRRTAITEFRSSRRASPFFTDEELVAALVMNQATGTIYEAEKGAGATRNGDAIAPSGQTRCRRVDRELLRASLAALGLGAVPIARRREPGDLSRRRRIARRVQCGRALTTQSLGLSRRAADRSTRRAPW